MFRWMLFGFALVGMSVGAGCGSTCSGKWGVVVVALTGVSYEQARDMTGEMVYGQSTLAVGCPGVGSATGGVTGVCDLDKVPPAIVLSGYNVDLAVRQTTVTLRAADGTVLADHAVVNLSDPKLVEPHDSTAYCAAGGALVR